MMMSGIAILIVILTGYIWMTRGFFSGLIHLVCVIIAGAVAFGAWEYASLAIIDFAPNSGFLSFLSGTAWAMGLAFPFAITLALLRVGVDSVIRANVSPGTMADYIGGGLCGALAGVIVSGIAVMSLSMLRMETEFWGATHVGYADKGYIVRTGSGRGGLLIPFDTITAKLYGRLSETTFRTDEPLARYYPNMQEVGASLRLSPFEGKGRNTSRPDDFEVMSRFTLGKNPPLKPSSLFSDSWNAAPQDVKDLDGNPFPDGTYIEGFIVNFKAGAKEKDGKVAVGAGQVRLVLENTQDESERKDVYPMSVASQAESTSTTAARWRYDARDVFIASVGGASEAPMAFEFAVPPGYQPTALFIKGIRYLISDPKTATPKFNFKSTQERDMFILNMGGGGGALPSLPDLPGGGSSGSSGGSSGSGFDGSQAVTVGTGKPIAANELYMPEGVSIRANLPFPLQDGTLPPSLEISSEGKKVVVDGTADLDPDYRDKTRGIERSLRIEGFQTTDDTVIVQVDVSASSKSSLLGQAAATAERILPPLLVDTNGQSYQPVGYIYEDQTKISIRFTPGQPVRALSETPSLSKSNPSQKLTLIFRVSFGATVQRFTLGKKVVAEYDPPFPCNVRQSK